MTNLISAEKNEIVYLKIKGSDGKFYECVGVIMHEDKEKIRIAFNAHNDVAEDYIEILKVDIVCRKKVSDKLIEVVK